MPIAFSLAHLTVLGLPPPEMIHVAARTGYRKRSVHGSTESLTGAARFPPRAG